MYHYVYEKGEECILLQSILMIITKMYSLRLLLVIVPYGLIVFNIKLCLSFLLRYAVYTVFS